MSLNLRIILSAMLVLAIFVTLTAATLERAFRESAESAQRDRLTGQLYALMAAAELDERGQLLMPSNELDALLGLPSSGVYAHTTDRSGHVLWQSSSTLGTEPPVPITLDGGNKHFTKIQQSGSDYYRFALGVNWPTESGTMALTFNIATDLESFNRQIAEFRTTLWSWLGAMALLLLISQASILHWGLLPLRRVGNELGRIESGDQDRIEDRYPQEIERLTDNINQLLQQERAQKTCYRNSLGDLAHSLKTPLAVMRSALVSKKPGDTETFDEQITRMNSIVEYQLKRAATLGPATIGKSVEVSPLVQRLLASLDKVYRDKQIDVKTRIEDRLVFQGDEGDLMEVLGNLLDNAFKWAKQHIELEAFRKNQLLNIHIRDDGPGMPDEMISALLQRGVRADQSTAGHGIGLSIVKSIVDACQGELRITQRPHGGSEVVVIL
jgi:two-component system sensor histidine kinase PhoQ